MLITRLINFFLRLSCTSGSAPASVSCVHLNRIEILYSLAKRWAQIFAWNSTRKILWSLNCDVLVVSLHPPCRVSFRPRFQHKFTSAAVSVNPIIIICKLQSCPDLLVWLWSVQGYKDKQSSSDKTGQQIAFKRSTSLRFAYGCDAAIYSRSS